MKRYKIPVRTWICWRIRDIWARFGKIFDSDFAYVQAIKWARKGIILVKYHALNKD